jgi:hypothetical protein
MPIESIDSVDQYEWREHRNNFENTIKLWCLQNNVDFFGTYNTIRFSKKEKIVKLTVFELMAGSKELYELDKLCVQENKQIFYITDNLVDDSNLHLQSIKILSVTELFGMVSQFDIQLMSNPSKLYNCFIQRVDQVRQSWFYFLQHHDLLDKGYVSFLLYQIQSYSELEGLELYDFIHKKYMMEKLPHFQQAYLDLRHNVPYRNFEENADLSVYLKDSKYCITLETYATEDLHIASCYTEKVQRALQFPSINLFFAQQNSLSKLKQIGFEIEDFMLEIDKHPWIQRQQMILDILVNDSIEFSPKELYNRAMHNKNLNKKYKDEFSKGKFYNKIFDKVLEK